MNQTKKLLTLLAIGACDVLSEAKRIVREAKDTYAPEAYFGPNGPTMSATNAFEAGILSLVFENANYANVGDATGLRGSSTAGSFHISLHTGDPGETGSQTTSESAYTSYARVAVARSTAGWTVSGTAPTQAANDGAVTFPTCTGGSSTVTYFGIGSDASGAGNLFISGALTASLAVSNNITPSFAIGALVVTLD